MFGLVGLLTVVFNVVLGSLRQSLTPDRLLGRVISAFRLFGYGAVPIGSLLGGVLARSFGLRAPFLAAGIVIPVAALLCLPAINDRNVAEARAAAGLGPGGQPSPPPERRLARATSGRGRRRRSGPGCWRGPGGCC